MKEYSDLRTKCIEAGNEWISSFSKVHPMKTMLDLHEKMVREQNYEENRYGHCIAGPLLYNKSVCEGFSKTVKFILNRMGIECTLVVGKGYDSDVGHMWNQVYMEKDWYNIDVTWDITTRTDGIVSFDHFMVSDRKNEYTHHSADSVNRCTSNRFDYYFYYDLIAVDDEAARRIIARELSNGKKIIYVEYKDKDMADRSQRVMEIALSEYTKRHRFKRARVSTSYDIRMQTYHIMFT